MDRLSARLVLAFQCHLMLDRKRVGTVDCILDGTTSPSRKLFSGRLDHHRRWEEILSRSMGDPH